VPEDRQSGEAGPKTWGKLARRGAGRVGEEHRDGASAAWREAMDEAERTPYAQQRGITPDEWVRDDELEEEASRAVGRGRRPDRVASPSGGRGESEIEDGVRADLSKAVGAVRVDRYERRLKDASRAFENERFPDAARILRKLADEAPTAAAVRELYGLTLYRLGRWRAAAKELEAFRLLGGSTEQHPVLADCYRALGSHSKVDELWDELKAASPGPDLVTEGRIVAAGSLIDRGDVGGAVSLLEQGLSFPKRAKAHHLRRAYALADAYERAGDVVRARELFGRVAAVDPDFADARRRQRALR
jgi:tetratricopeptide (TPR) repeat protein